MSDLPSRDQRKPFSDGRRATLPHLQCGVTVSSSWHDPVACAFERGHDGDHSWASLPALSPLAENERLREALERLYEWVYHGKGAVRNGMSVGSRVLPPELGNQVRAALAAVPEERAPDA